MGVLFDLKNRVDELIKIKRMDDYKTKGKIVLKTGFLLAVISEKTPDDPIKIEKLKNAIKEVFNIAKI